MPVQHHDAKSAYDLLQKNPDIRVLDVRRPDEYAEGHIDGAVLADFTAPTFRDEAARLDKSATWLVHCKSGGRSSNALPLLLELGFQNLHHLDGGMMGWEAAQLPTVK